MSAPIFYFDVASPNAYFAHRVLPGIESRTGARFDYVPVLLGGLFKLSAGLIVLFEIGGDNDLAALLRAK